MSVFYCENCQEYFDLDFTDCNCDIEPLICEHNVITITDRDEGKCADCGVEMIRTWQPNCG